MIVKCIFWTMFTELPRKVRGGSLTSNLHNPLIIRQLTQTPLYLVLFYFSLNSSNTRSSIELEEFNLISKYFLESGLSWIWRLNLNPAGSLRMSSQNSSELRKQETKGTYSFRSVKLHDFARLFTGLCWCFLNPFIKKLLSRMERDHWIGVFLRCWLFWGNLQENFYDFLGWLKIHLPLWQ